MYYTIRKRASPFGKGGQGGLGRKEPVSPKIKMRKNRRQTIHSLFIAIALHLVFAIYLSIFVIKTAYEPKESISVDMVKPPPVEITPRKKAMPEELPVVNIGGSTARKKTQKVESVRSSTQKLSEIILEEPEFDREGIALAHRVRISDILPEITPETRFETSARTKHVASLPLSRMPTVIGALGEVAKPGGIKVVGEGDGKRVPIGDSLGTDRGGGVGRGGFSGTGVGEGLGDGIGDGFADVGTSAPRGRESRGDTDGKKVKDTFGIGTYVEDTRGEGKEKIIYLLDVSGSMKGRKLPLAVNALKDALKMLKPGDSFNLITFADGIIEYSKKMQPVTEQNRKRIFNHLGGVRTRNGTNISAALERALATPVTTIVLISDGSPSRGEKDSRKIVALVRAKNKHNARILTIGLGIGKNFAGTQLLRWLAEQNNGQMRLIDITKFAM